jgi:hypothetical protein
MLAVSASVRVMEAAHMRSQLSWYWPTKRSIYSGFSGLPSVIAFATGMSNRLSLSWRWSAVIFRFSSDPRLTLF